MQALRSSTVSDLEIKDEFASLPINAKFNQVAELLSNKRVNVILVTEGKKKEVIGVITENHFLEICASRIDPLKCQLKNRIKTNILRLKHDTPLDIALRLLDEKKPDAVIIMNTAREFKGYLSPSDFRKLRLELSLDDNMNDDISSKQKNTKRSIVQSRNSLIKPTTPASYHNISNVTHKASQKGIDKLESDAKQLVKLALHFCSDDGRVNQSSSRRGARHEHIFCIGKAGPAGTRGVWAVDENEVTDIVKESLDSSNKFTDDMYCLTWLSDEERFIPSSWLSKVDSIWNNNGGDYQLNCLIMNQPNQLLGPELIAVQKLSKANLSKVKNGSNVNQIEILANELITHKNVQNIEHNRILLCASICAN